MKTLPSLSTALAAALILYPSSFLPAQGPLAPPGAPAPTMKSLQEIWDKIGALQTQNQALQTTVDSQQQEIASQTVILNALAGVNGLPKWQLSVVDPTANVGATSLQLTPGGQPAIAYYEDSTDDLRYAVFNGVAWSFTTVDSTGDVGTWASLAFTPGGQPAISYYDATNANLKYAYFDGATWIRSIADSTGSVGQYSSLAFTPGGQPAISYYDTTNSALKYATLAGVIWVRTTVDNTAAVGLGTSIAITPGGQPAIAYRDSTNTAIKYAVYNGASWSASTVEANANSYTPSLAFSPGGQPAICYVTADTLGYALFDGASWAFAIVDGTIGAGSHSSLIFKPDGYPAIAYQYRLGDTVRYAAFNGTAWQIETVATASFAPGSYGEPFISLGLTSGGQPALTYLEDLDGIFSPNPPRLVYAVRPNFPVP